jgi:hypothetical protein
MTRDEFVDKLMLLHEKRKVLRNLAENRRTEEQAIATKYKVDDCNAERNALVASYTATANTIQAEIKAIEESL